MQRHDESFIPPDSGRFLVDRKKIQIKFVGRPQSETNGRIESSAGDNEPISPGDSHVNRRLKPVGSPRQFTSDFIDSDPTTNPNRFLGAAIHHHRIHHQHRLIPPRRLHNRHRFSVTQAGNKAAEELIGNEPPAGETNDPHSAGKLTEIKKLLGHSQSMSDDDNYAMRNLHNQVNAGIANELKDDLKNFEFGKLRRTR